jgi:hypothetical protein
MYIIGDLVHHSALILDNPNIKFYADVDQDLGVKSRMDLLSKAAKERAALFGCHLPWPVLGHVADQGKNFKYFPCELRW